MQRRSRIIFILLTLLCVFVRANAQDASKMYLWQRDSAFLRHSTAITFSLNRHDLPTHICDSIVSRLHTSLCPGAYIRIRGAASPEGTYSNNVRLSNGRANLLRQFLLKVGVPDSSIHVNVVVEDYPMLLSMMQQRNDPDYERILQLVRTYLTDPTHPEALKEALYKERYGWLWRHLLNDYFPSLRATRITVICPEEEIEPTAPLPFMAEDVKIPVVTTIDTVPQTAIAIVIPQDTLPLRIRRKEMFSIKTNLLMDLAYVPRYGFCPMWNVALEFYPLNGHYTVGASFDCPWWVKPSQHKYFQARNYELFARRYFNKKGIYRGWYAEVYGNATKYGIGFNADDGWQGEGFGGGLGAGYVMGLTRNKHLKLEFNLQVGCFWTKYDPYQYTCPVEGIDDGRYYYKWIYDSNLFRERQYHRTWIGPTRVGITLSWDFLYYSKKKSNPQP